VRQLRSDRAVVLVYQIAPAAVAERGRFLG
jgi:hypothetical protein